MVLGSFAETKGSRRAEAKTREHFLVPLSFKPHQAILAMNAFDHGESELTEEAEDELDRMAPELIHVFVRNLNAWTKARAMQWNWQRRG